MNNINALKEVEITQDDIEKAKDIIAYHSELMGDLPYTWCEDELNMCEIILKLNGSTLYLTEGQHKSLEYIRR